MGNCCASPVAGKNDVRHKKGERLANWQATGVIGLRAASLKVNGRLAAVLAVLHTAA
jgi:hypothetical protein